ncbi:pyridoxine kinase, partial [Megasphaera massiliensis]|nr:pyridoxine kinase [Megasphaera massiliensis]
FMTTKRVLAIHDLCSLVRCSLTAAIPVISAMGFQVCPFPTAIFSNNLTYGDFTISDFTPHMTEIMDKWQKLGYEYDA